MDDELLKLLKYWIEKDTMVKFYQSRAWRYIKQRAHERDNYECQMCRQRGLYHKVENVHHIKEVKDKPSMALLLSNTLCLCIPCHNAIHGKVQYKKGRQASTTISSGEFQNLDDTETW